MESTKVPRKVSLMASGFVAPGDHPRLNIYFVEEIEEVGAKIGASFFGPDEWAANWVRELSYAADNGT